MKTTLVNNNTNKMVVIDANETTKKIERVEILTTLVDGGIDVRGIAFCTTDNKPVRNHFFAFGKVTEFNQANIASKVIALALSKLPTGFAEQV